MIGFILVTHTEIGKEIQKAVEEILKEPSNIPYVGYDAGRPLQETQEKIRQVLETMKDKSGVILLTDLFGATPSNLCKGLCVPGKIEMVAGCNLHMILKASTARFDKTLPEVVEFLKTYGSENIRVCHSH